MCFSHTLTNFVQFFTANESHDSFSQSNAAHWGTLEVTKKKHVHSIRMELEYRWRIKHGRNLCPSILKAEVY